MIIAADKYIGRNEMSSYASITTISWASNMWSQISNIPIIIIIILLNYPRSLDPGSEEITHYYLLLLYPDVSENPYAFIRKAIMAVAVGVDL